MISPGSAASFRFSEVRGVAVDVEDHGTGAVAYFCVRMSGGVVQEMNKCFDGGLGSVFLGGSHNV
jgi:hypothetical protein